MSKTFCKIAVLSVPYCSHAFVTVFVDATDRTIEVELFIETIVEAMFVSGIERRKMSETDLPMSADDQLALGHVTVVELETALTKPRNVI